MLEASFVLLKYIQTIALLWLHGFATSTLHVIQKAWLKSFSFNELLHRRNAHSRTKRGSQDGETPQKPAQRWGTDEKKTRFVKLVSLCKMTQGEAGESRAISGCLCEAYAREKPTLEGSSKLLRREHNDISTRIASDNQRPFHSLPRGQTKGSTRQ